MVLFSVFDRFTRTSIVWQHYTLRFGCPIVCVCALFCVSVCVRAFACMRSCTHLGTHIFFLCVYIEHDVCINLFGCVTGTSNKRLSTCALISPVCAELRTTTACSLCSFLVHVRCNATRIDGHTQTRAMHTKCTISNYKRNACGSPHILLLSA